MGMCIVIWQGITGPHAVGPFHNDGEAVAWVQARPHPLAAWAIYPLEEPT